MGSHEDATKKPFKWNILRRTLYLGVGSAAGGLGVSMSEDLKSGIAYLVTMGIAFLASWFTNE